MPHRQPLSAGPWYGLWHNEDKCWTRFSTCTDDLEDDVYEFGDHLSVRRIWDFEVHASEDD